MPRAQTQRFAIATFNSGSDVEIAVRMLARLGADVGDMELLANQQAFSAGAAALGGALTSAPRQISFPAHTRLISCTPGPIATLLARKQSTGNDRLADALASSIFQRLALSLEQAVEQDRLLLWVLVRNADVERRVGLTLLALKPHSYEVHDIEAAAMCD
jgi:hypothetical protein